MRSHYTAMVPGGKPLPFANQQLTGSEDYMWNICPDRI